MNKYPCKFVITLLYFLILLATFTQNSSLARDTKNNIVHYEPDVVELSGTLERQTFPGPPNYESIKDGDVMERHWYLRLSSPVDVVATDPHSAINSESENNVNIMQLVLGYEDPLWKILKNVRIGTSATITGTLYHRHTGHHHSRVLLNVDEMRIEK